jgi:hypothetical protein
VKLECEYCKEEITEDEFLECDHFLLHEEDCFLEFMTLHHAIRFTRKGYLESLNRSEAEQK